MAFQTAAKVRRGIRKQTLLDAIEGDHATVRELSEETDIPKRTTRKLVNELLDEDRLAEVGTTEAGAQGAPIYALSQEASR